MRLPSLVWLILLSAACITAGCGGFVARRMVQAPNTYPAWLAPPARVELAFSPELLTNFPAHFVAVGPPEARMQYRIVEPADYGFRVTATNWLQCNRSHFRFSFKAVIPASTNAWTALPRGTVVLLHGYGMGEFVMVPWALRLAQEGWRTVLVDLRGHGESTGRKVYYGLREAHDLSQLLDDLSERNQLRRPVAALGESYGAALTLRWKAQDSRVGNVIVIAPYPVLSNAVVNLCRENARWLPSCVVRAGLKRLPGLLQVAPSELDPETILARQPVDALFVAGKEDRVMPAADVRRLFAQASAESRFLVVPEATHEALPFFFDDLATPVLAWLEGQPPSSNP